MYGFRNLKRDWLWVLGIGVVGALAFIVALDAVGEMNVNRAWRQGRVEFLGFAAVLILAISFIPLSFRTLMFVQHKGWQRVLILLSLAAFVYPIIMISQDRYVTWQEVVFGGTAVGLFFAAVAIAVPQLLFGVFRWVRSGFTESQPEGGGDSG